MPKYRFSQKRLGLAMLRSTPTTNTTIMKITFRHTTIFILLLFFGLTCSRNPVTGKKELMLLSSKQEQALGDESDPAIVASYGLYQDEKLQAFIDEKGQQMAKISHRPDLKYEFKILDSPVVNAFALPGGYVYFTRGIMAHFNNEAEFAGVLGHEIGHITARHSASQYSKQILAQVGLVAGLVAVPEFAQFAQSAQQGLGLLFLKFGRDDETESDQLGVEYSTKIGYDANEMANFFNTLDRMREGTSAESLPSFLSTHPDPGDRNIKVGQLATKWQAKNTGGNYKINRDSYLKMIDGLIYGEDPKQGYVDNNVFYHPELLFQFPVPSGWQLQNSPSQVVMAPEGGKAAMIFSLAQENSVDSAATAFVQKNKMTVVDSRNTTVNGFPAIALLSDQNNAQEPAKSLRVLSYFIEYNNIIYLFYGLATKSDYAGYQAAFEPTMKGFRKLTDRSKIDVKPDRINIVTVSNGGTLSQVLEANNIPQDKFREHSLINGMELNEQVASGSLLKILRK